MFQPCQVQRRADPKNRLLLPEQRDSEKKKKKVLSMTKNCSTKTKKPDKTQEKAKNKQKEVS